ncbi:MAG: hypothetical protein JW862_07170 [Anaerolineales bacterium]|nr:hypothetical protein [Anaerolineales bacterium]
MPRTQIPCPNCRQPIVADVQQLFDLNQDPQAKQKLLSGAFNLAQCPACGYQGNLATPIVYHDPDKELLLTFYPPELHVPVQEQERAIGPLITQVTNNLPQEKRKGYLLRPQTMLTLQGMLERILEADGITKEMMRAQEERFNLIQRLLGASSEDVRKTLIRENDALIDGSFFSMLSRLMEAAVMGRDQNAAQAINALQAQLLEESTQGKKLGAEAQEVQAAVESLQALGRELTREKLLDLVIAAPSEARLRALVQLVRQGMDYSFLQMLSDRIDAATGEERARLEELRTKILAYSKEVDDAMQERIEMTQRNLEAVLQAENMRQLIEENIEAFDDIFMQVLMQELEKARQAGDLGRSAKLQEAVSIIDELTKAPAEYEFIDDLMDQAGDPAALKAAVEANAEKVTPELIQMLTGLIGQGQAALEAAEDEVDTEQKEMLDRLQQVYQAVLGFSMRRSMKGS